MKHRGKLSLLWLFMGWLLWDNLRVVNTYYELPSEHLPKAFNGLRLLQVSDYHNASYKKAILKKVSILAPDIIVITGDLIDSRKRAIREGLDFVCELVKLAPCYYVTGNHEKRLDKKAYQALTNGLKALGVVVLKDEVSPLVCNGERFYIVGLSDLGTWQSKKRALRLTEEKLGHLVKDDGFYLVLSHRPELFEAYHNSGVSLALTGHAHGGQFRFFKQGLFAPHQGFLPNYTSGLYQKEDFTMVVSRGLGRSILPLRLNNPPELVLLVLKAKEA